MNQTSYLSTPELLIRLLTKKKKPLDRCVGFKQEFRDCYVKSSNYQGFRRLFTAPENLPSFVFIASFKSAIQTLALSPIPSGLLGLVHLSNKVEIKKKPNWLLPFNTINEITKAQSSDKGIFYQVTTIVTQGNQTVAEMNNDFLARDKQYRSSKTSFNNEDNKNKECVARFEVNQSIALQYAQASSDYNPIHLSNLTARIFGLPKALIHGMYNVHATLLELQKSSGKTIMNYSVNFNRPCYLPNNIVVVESVTDNFELFNPSFTERFAVINIEG